MSTPERTSKKPSRKRATTTDTKPQIGKNDIKHSARETWRKLDEVIQTELASVQKGEKELNASTATAIIRCGDRGHGQCRDCFSDAHRA